MAAAAVRSISPKSLGAARNACWLNQQCGLLLLAAPSCGGLAIRVA
jgi:hypothetical protein